jgi:hypothetical protein
MPASDFVHPEFLIDTASLERRLGEPGLLLINAQAVLGSKRAKTDPWLKRLLDTKPRLVAAVALANKTARIIWAVMVRQTNFREAAAMA